MSSQHLHESLYFAALYDEESFRSALEQYALSVKDTALSQMLQFMSKVDKFQTLRGEENRIQLAQSIIREFSLDDPFRMPMFLASCADEVQHIVRTVSIAAWHKTRPFQFQPYLRDSWTSTSASSPSSPSSLSFASFSTSSPHSSFDNFQLKQLEEFEDGREVKVQCDLFDNLWEIAFNELQYDVFPRFVASTQFSQWRKGMLKQMEGLEEEFMRQFSLNSSDDGGSDDKSPHSTGYHRHRMHDDVDDDDDDDDGDSNDIVHHEDMTLPPVPPVVDLSETVTEQHKAILKSLKMTVRDLEELVVQMSRPQHMGGALRNLNTTVPKRTVVFRLGSRRQTCSPSQFSAESLLRFIETEKHLQRADALRLSGILLDMGIIANEQSEQRKAAERRMFDLGNTYYFTRRKRLVIVGCGFAGLQLVRQLADEFDITVIDQRIHFEFKSVFHAMFNSPDLYSKICFSYSRILPAGVQIVQGAAVHVSTDAVFVKPSDSSAQSNQSELIAIPFDYVVLATGSSYSPPFPVRTSVGGSAPIMVYPYKSQSILKSVDKLKSAKRIAVIGGGPLAIEVTGEVAHLTRDMPETQVVQITHCNFLLERLNQDAHKAAYRFLSQYPNVSILFNRRVVAIEDDQVMFSFNQRTGGAGSRIELRTQSMQFDAIIICVGMYPNTSMMERFMSSSLTSRGYVEIDPATFRVVRSGANARDIDPNVFELTPISDTEIPDKSKLTENSNVRHQDINTDQDHDKDGQNFVPESPIMGSEEQFPDNRNTQRKEYYEHIFAIGDIAMGTQEEKLAYFARNHARALANILRYKERDLPLGPVSYRPAPGNSAQYIAAGPKNMLYVHGSKVTYGIMVRWRRKFECKRDLSGIACAKLADW